MKKPVTMIRNAAGVFVATKMSERFVQRTRKKFGGSLVKMAVGGLVLYGTLVVTGAIFGAAISAVWWALTLPLYHPILTTVAALGTWIYFKGKKLLG